MGTPGNDRAAGLHPTVPEEAHRGARRLWKREGTGDAEAGTGGHGDRTSNRHDTGLGDEPSPCGARSTPRWAIGHVVPGERARRREDTQRLAMHARVDALGGSEARRPAGDTGVAQPIDRYGGNDTSQRVDTSALPDQRGRGGGPLDYDSARSPRGQVATVAGPTGGDCHDTDTLSCPRHATRAARRCTRVQGSGRTGPVEREGDTSIRHETAHGGRDMPRL